MNMLIFNYISIIFLFQLIDKREKRLLKKDLRNIKPKRKKKALRRCSREFVTFCDSNNNKQITLAEWLECTGVTGK